MRNELEAVKESGTFRISSFHPLNRKDQPLVYPSDSAEQVGKFGMSPILSQLLAHYENAKERLVCRGGVTILIDSFKGLTAHT